MSKLFAMAVVPLAGLLLASSAAGQDKPLTLAQRQAAVVAGKYAVVVGINDYAAEDITDLRYCEGDAALFADALKRTCGYPEGHVVMLMGQGAQGERSSRR